MRGVDDSNASRSCRSYCAHSNEYSSESMRAGLRTYARCSSKSRMAYGGLPDQLADCLLRYRLCGADAACCNFDLLSGIHVYRLRLVRRSASSVERRHLHHSREDDHGCPVCGHDQQKVCADYAGDSRRCPHLETRVRLRQLDDLAPQAAKEEFQSGLLRGSVVLNDPHLAVRAEAENRTITQAHAETASRIGLQQIVPLHAIAKPKTGTVAGR